MKPVRKNGFTLIELLVALAILGVIVVLCGRIFQQANASWTTGSRKAEINMIGRGIADFIAQDISRCVPGTLASPTTLSGNSPSFTIVDETRIPVGSGAISPTVKVSYLLSGPLERTVEGEPKAVMLPVLPANMNLAVSATVEPRDILPGVDLPGYVDVTVTVEDTAKGYPTLFKSRAWLANRYRYKYDEQ
jgi:prepilin-type N-terminal cleavage/methylation domain-containing protein